jgi:cbb3-type cytochrome oxidase maturation protein
LSAIYVLIPLAMVVLALSIWLFFWAVKRGQFDDLDSPGHSILMEDEPATRQPSSNADPDANTPAAPQTKNSDGASP